MSKDLTPAGETELIRPEESVKSWDDFDVASVDLNYEYWTPEKQGEVRFGFFKGIHERDCPDFNNPTVMKSLACAVFHDPAEDRVFMSASAILVRVIGTIPIGKAVRIEYRGKVKAKNGNNCDDWKVNVLEKKPAS